MFNTEAKPVMHSWDTMGLRAHQRRAYYFANITEHHVFLVIARVNQPTPKDASTCYPMNKTSYDRMKGEIA
jgi:hypothetical protein